MSNQSSLVQQYMALDPNLEYFIEKQVRPRNNTVYYNPVVWSEVFNQPVRYVHICNLPFERLLGKRNDVPARDPYFYPLASDVEPFCSGVVLGHNIALSGHAGTGKTALIEQMAALLNRPFYVYDVNEDTRPEVMLGQYLPSEGNKLEWKDGPVTKALKNPGSFFLLDEANFASGSILACMHRVLACRETTLHEHEGEVIKAAPGVIFSMACNALNDSNSATMYHDIKPMNRAFLDRFSTVIRTNYPTKAQEIQIIMSKLKKKFQNDYSELVKAGIKHTVSKVVDVATQIRAGIDRGELDISFSLRKTIGWAESYAFYGDFMKATKYSVLNLEETENAKLIDITVHSIFGDKYVPMFKSVNNG